MTTLAFVSYSKYDHAIVARLRSGLAERGIGLWMDTEDLPDGMLWSEAVESAIASARFVLLAVSSHWAASEPCRFELKCARDRGKTLVAVDVSDALSIAILPAALLCDGVEAIDGGGALVHTIEAVAARLVDVSVHPLASDD